MKMPDLSRYMPVGREKSSQPMQGGIFMLVVATLRAVVELMDNYLHAWESLYLVARPMQTLARQRTLIPGAVIRPFPELIQSSLDFFPWFWAFMLWEVIDCYLYHRKGSMSIYLMRRLPDSRELHRRCWGRPLIWVGRSVLLMTAILLFYVLVYIVFTPKECLPF